MSDIDDNTSNPTNIEIRLAQLETAQNYLMSWPMAAGIAGAAWVAIVGAYWFLSPLIIDPIVKIHTDPLKTAEIERKAEYKQIVEDAAKDLTAQFQIALEQLQKTTLDIEQAKTEIIEASAKLKIEPFENSATFASLEKFENLGVTINDFSQKLEEFEVSLTAMKAGQLAYWPLDTETVTDWKTKFPMDAVTQEKLDALGDIQWFAVPGKSIGIPMEMK